MKRLLVFYFLLLLASAWLTSCDVTKSLFRSKSKSKTTESNEVSKTTSRQLSEDWSQVGATLQHRDGMLAIQFDGDAVIDIRPDGSLQFSGESPTILGTLSSTTQDTTATAYSRTEDSTADSTGRAEKEALDESLDKETFKEQKTQKIWPILLLSLLILLVLILMITKGKGWITALFRPKIP